MKYRAGPSFPPEILTLIGEHSDWETARRIRQTGRAGLAVPPGQLSATGQLIYDTPELIFDHHSVASELWNDPTPRNRHTFKKLIEKIPYPLRCELLLDFIERMLEYYEDFDDAVGDDSDEAVPTNFPVFHDVPKTDAWGYQERYVPTYVLNMDVFNAKKHIIAFMGDAAGDETKQFSDFLQSNVRELFHTRRMRAKLVQFLLENLYGIIVGASSIAHIDKEVEERSIGEFSDYLHEMEVPAERSLPILALLRDLVPNVNKRMSAQEWTGLMERLPEEAAGIVGVFVDTMNDALIWESSSESSGSVSGDSGSVSGADSDLDGS